MCYILTTGPKSFLKIKDNQEIVISSNPDKASKFKIVGDAIKAAVLANDMLGTHIVKFITIDSI